MVLEKSAFSDVHLSYTLEKRKMPLVLLYVCDTKVTAFIINSNVIKEYDLYISPKCFLFLMARFWSRDYGRSVSLTESSHSLTVLVSIVSYLQAELNISDKPANATGISSHNSGSVNSKNSNIWDMKISAFSMVEDILSKVASNMTENLWQSVIEVSDF